VPVLSVFVTLSLHDALPILMCWAGLDRAHRMHKAGFLPSLTFDLDAARARAAQALLNATKDGSLRNGPKDETYDASLAQAAILGDRKSTRLNSSHVKTSYAV